MPRSKCKLAEITGNAEPVQRLKRAPIAKDASKENTHPEAESTTRSEMRKQVVEGQEVIIVNQDKAILTFPQIPSSEAIAHANRAPGGDDYARAKAYDADDTTWTCLCRSTSDRQREYPELDSDVIERHPGRGNCMCGRFADRNPGYKWIVTNKASQLFREAIEQASGRDQGAYGIYLFNRWDGYGICEVVENMVGLPACFGIEREANAKRLMLIGTALLSVIDVLISHSLFHSDSNTKIRNIGFIICYYIYFAHQEHESCRNNEAGWTRVLVQKAEEHGVHIEGLYGIEDMINALNASPSKTITSASASSNKHQRPSRGVSNLNMIHAYESAPPLVGVLTLELLRAHEEGGTPRDWSKYDLKKEISAYKRLQAIKVGVFGPEDYGGSTIGGKFYDLSAPRNRALVREKRKEAAQWRRELDEDGEESE
ncbi:MAG: hypothetical protein LQ343_001226 [Gyalolechia ehrenbergii]|nr:MAG: hypothetical protein LQ343_001226 [Gyalolechia ehrenbergii]